VNIIKSILNIFRSKESIFNNLEARNIMIDESNFNKMNLTLGNTFKVNGNIKIKNFKEKINFLEINMKIKDENKLVQFLKTKINEIN